MKNLRRDYDPAVPAGRYETWNPSDIWAVRGMNSVKERIIKSITPKHQHLIELNNLLIELMENEELVGVSLKKVNFGDPNMRIKKSNPKRRKSFRARHNCDNPGPKTKARYWSCRKW